MSLQLVLGSSGSGKSQYIYSKAIRKSMECPDKNIYIIVPEQYTMAVQKRIVEMHPKKGIINIDVVSFERLAYKVFEEVGGDSLNVLDDTGKNLIIRRVMEQNKNSLKFFNGNLNNTGFVTEMKSVISEMLQYNINVEKLGEISEASVDNSALSAKLSDINVIYSAFKEFLGRDYVTSEEILDVLCGVIDKSQLIRNSELVFDGFTGFTPIQYKLLRILFNLSEKVNISLTIDNDEKINVLDGMENIFYMSKDTIARLYRLCDEEHIKIEEPVRIISDVNRFKNSDELAFLEKNIFRNKPGIYDKEVNDIKIYSATVPKDELKYTASQILKLTRLGGYKYKDIAVVTGDIEGYGQLACNILKQNDIPVFLDYKRKVADNPLVQMIKSSLEIIEKGYTYDSVFRFLRTGMTDIERQDIDILDNYCVALGIRGRKAWVTEWSKTYRRFRGNADLNRLNELRNSIVSKLETFGEDLKAADGNVTKLTKALYDFIVAMDGSRKLLQLADRADSTEEYKQIYIKVMELLDKVVLLLGSENVTLKEYIKILDSGFDEIKIGLIPPTRDCIVIGDIERTRLDNIKVLFFVGVNDGVIPKRSDVRSVLSDMDRETLMGKGIELSPSPRQKAFLQRFYLYLIMTKTSEKLYITYAGRDISGKGIFPSYLIKIIRRMYPLLDVIYAEENEHKYLKIPKSELVWSEENIINAISESVAADLYTDKLVGSVTSFEEFASCRYAYFLQYGLRLQEREEYRFAVSDFGTILHGVIENVSSRVKKEKKSFSLLTDEERRSYVESAIESIAKDYGNTILQSSTRNEFLIKRMTGIADRTIWAIGKQLESGVFKPDEFEASFLVDIDKLPHDKTFLMQGKIDRIDICEDDENVYVRVVDYKSGKSDFELLKAYYGLKIQLITYMKAAMNIEKKKHPGKNIIPAGLLYYNISDPIIDISDNEEKDVETAVRYELRMKGIVNSNDEIIRKMDDSEKESLSIPVTRKTDGSIDERKSKVMSGEQFGNLLEYVDKKSLDNAKGILSGDVSCNPINQGQIVSCTYCPYKSVCGFSTDLGGEYRKLKKFDSDILWENIGKGVDENGKTMD